MTQLDSFESALLAELRREVVERPAPVPPPTRRPRRRLRVAAVGATGVAASVVAVFGLGSTGGTPAYAVEENGVGDVIITVHRLDDAAGLEKALRARGIDADVSYDADGFGTSFGIGPDGKPVTEYELPAPSVDGGGEGPSSMELGTTSGSEDADDGPSFTFEGRNAEGGRGTAPEDDPCGLGSDPATLTQDGSDWVLRIPAGSPLQDRHVEIGTDSSGALSVMYAGDEPGSACGMVSMTRGLLPD